MCPYFLCIYCNFRNILKQAGGALSNPVILTVVPESTINGKIAQFSQRTCIALLILLRIAFFHSRLTEQVVDAPTLAGTFQALELHHLLSLHQLYASTRYALSSGCLAVYIQSPCLSLLMRLEARSGRKQGCQMNIPMKALTHPAIMSDFAR